VKPTLFTIFFFALPHLPPIRHCPPLTKSAEEEVNSSARVYLKAVFFPHKERRCRRNGMRRRTLFSASFRGKRVLEALWQTSRA